MLKERERERGSKSVKEKEEKMIWKSKKEGKKIKCTN